MNVQNLDILGAEADADSIIPVARVLMLGASGVGKTSLCSKFLSSGNKNSYEPDCESVEMEVVQQQRQKR